MAPPNLDELAALGLLAPKPPDRGRVARWLARSRKDLDLPATVLAGAPPGTRPGRAPDRERPMAAADEAGYRVGAGILDLAGYRVTSQPGHHRAAIDGATIVLGGERRALLRRLDRARRVRPDAPAGAARGGGLRGPRGAAAPRPRPPGPLGKMPGDLPRAPVVARQDGRRSAVRMP